MFYDARYLARVNATLVCVTRPSSLRRCWRRCTTRRWSRCAARACATRARRARCAVQGADERLSACVPVEELDCSLASVPLLAADGGVHVPLCVDAKRNVIRVHSRPARDSCPITDNKGACVAAVVRTPQPFDWGLEDEDEDSVAFPSDAARRRQEVRAARAARRRRARAVGVGALRPRPLTPSLPPNTLHLDLDGGGGTLRLGCGHTSSRNGRYYVRVFTEVGTQAECIVQIMFEKIAPLPPVPTLHFGLDAGGGTLRLDCGAHECRVTDVTTSVFSWKSAHKRRA